jgi:hypothetical protein
MQGFYPGDRIDSRSYGIRAPLPGLAAGCIAGRAAASSP